MAVTVINPVVLAVGTASIDLVGGGTVASAPADGWVIPTRGLAGGRLGLVFEADGSGDTVTFLAGDRAPAHRSGLAPGTVTLAANDLKVVWVDGSRYMHDDGQIKAVCTDEGTRCYAIIVPVGP